MDCVERGLSGCNIYFDKKEPLRTYILPLKNLSSCLKDLVGKQQECYINVCVRYPVARMWLLTGISMEDVHCVFQIKKYNYRIFSIWRPGALIDSRSFWRDA